MTLDFNVYSNLSRQAIAEGAVLLNNNNNALPLEKNCQVAVFGRIQHHYYKSGTGSGGMVNVTKVTGILDALIECPDVSVNQELIDIYTKWDHENPFDPGMGWSSEPFSQKEMPVSDELAQAMAAVTDVAIVIIGRIAGEDNDIPAIPGAYYLTETEMDMLNKVRHAYTRMVVVLNVGSILDMRFVDWVKPDAVLYAWQGGMLGGYGTVDILTGVCSPSGKLTDTIANTLEDYPSTPFYGNPVRNFYAEDIYVGYRYFETFKPENVLYPFGFGLSYTTFSIQTNSFSASARGSVKLSVSVKNTGILPGKEVVQVYVMPPQGALGKAKINLIGFQKTKELLPGESQTLDLDIAASSFSSYDDSGITGHKSCFVLEAGKYSIHVGNSVRDTSEVGILTCEELLVTSQLEEALAPVLPYQRMKPILSDDGRLRISWEDTPSSTIDETVRCMANLPSEIPYVGDQGYKLNDVKNNTVSMDTFLAQLTDDDLICMIRGEGMGSPKVTPGTAAAFGGVLEHLKELGIPCGCCSDGPSGMRIDSGFKAFSLPCGTMLASTFNLELLESLYTMTGWEMVKNKVDTLLGPGMNIHRNPLNGRNFEYFSEDPLVTGKIASAQLRGLHAAGVTGTIKHFCGNNQEHRRHEVDAVISERALREIYLRGFEIAVKEGKATSIMTTYGAVNGVWTAGRYDLNTHVLRKEWGFQGIVMTDWWAAINERGGRPDKTNFAAMVRSQNDVYMVCPDAEINSSGDNTLDALQSGKLTRAELQQSARNVCRFLLNTHALTRMNGHDVTIEVINQPKQEEDLHAENIVYYHVEDKTVIDMENVDTKKGSIFVFALETTMQGGYLVELTAKSDMGELAQIPVAFYGDSILCGVFVWNGTNGKWTTQNRRILLKSKYSVVRFHFQESGLNLKNIRFILEKKIMDIENIDDYMKN